MRIFVSSPNSFLVLGHLGITSLCEIITVTFYCMSSFLTTLSTIDYTRTRMHAFLKRIHYIQINFLHLTRVSEMSFRIFNYSRNKLLQESYGFFSYFANHMGSYISYMFVGKWTLHQICKSLEYNILLSYTAVSKFITLSRLTLVVRILPCPAVLAFCRGRAPVHRHVEVVSSFSRELYFISCL